jgi:phospholipid transport system substrate-binding protein
MRLATLVLSLFLAAPALAQELAPDELVRNQVQRPGQQSVPVDHAMKKEPDGWMIYDITVDGVSLVLTYRDEFNQITKASGIDGLIKRLKEKNA